MSKKALPTTVPSRIKETFPNDTSISSTVPSASLKSFETSIPLEYFLPNPLRAIEFCLMLSNETEERKVDFWSPIIKPERSLLFVLTILTLS